jgi:hypothetical protein
MEDYTLALDKAEDKVTEVAADESTTEEVKEELSSELQDTTEVDENIQENLDSQQQEQLEEETTEAAFTANVVKNLDATVVQALRDKGMGFGQIAHTIALSELSGKSVDEIAGLIAQGKGIGKIAKDLGIHPSKMNDKKSNEASEEQIPDGDAAGTTDTAGDAGTAAASDENTASETTTSTNTTNDVQTAVLTADSSVVREKTPVQVQAASVEPSGKKEVKGKTEKVNEDKEKSSIKLEAQEAVRNTSDDKVVRKVKLKMMRIKTSARTQQLIIRKKAMIKMVEV